MATTIASLAAKLVLDNSQFLTGFKQSANAAKGFGNNVAGFGRVASNGMTSLAASLGTAAAAYLSVREVSQQVGESLGRIDDQANLASRMGLDFKTVQQLGAAAKLSGTDLDTLAKATARMSRTVGSGGLSLDKRLFQLADSLNSINDPAERLARAQKIFGEGGLAVLNLDTNALREGSEMLDRFGLGLERLDVQNVQAAGDALDKLSITATGLKDKLVVQVAPGLALWADKLTGSLGRLSLAMDDVDGKRKKMSSTTEFLASLFSHVGLAEATLDFITAKSKGGLGGGSSARGSLLDSLLGDPKSFRSISPKAMGFNTVEAAQAIQQGGGNPLSAIDHKLGKALGILERIREGVDPRSLTKGERIQQAALAEAGI